MHLRPVLLSLAIALSAGAVPAGPAAAKDLLAALATCDALPPSRPRAEKVACYRAVAQSVPADSYLVLGTDPVSGVKARPFRTGPGSHRDNVLLQRFIELQAWSEARAELDRVRAIHERRAKEGTYDPRAAEFLLDYVYFAAERGDVEAATEPLLQALVRSTLNDPMRGYVPPGEIQPEEFIQRAYGHLKAHGKEDELVARLEPAVAAGNHNARQALIQVRTIQGDLPAAMRLELEGAAGYGPGLVQPIVRAGILERYQQTAAAIDTLEAARVSEAWTTGDAASRDAVLRQLRMLHTAAGNSEKAFDVRLQQFEDVEWNLVDVAALEREVASYDASGHGQQFREWARQRLPLLKVPAARASVHWILGDPAAAMTEVGEAVRQATHWSPYTEWKERAAAKGMLLPLLRGIVAADPKDAVSRIELLHHENRWEGPELVGALEALLEINDSTRYYVLRTHNLSTRAAIESPWDAASLLAALHQRAGARELLIEIAIRIAKFEKPFERRMIEMHGDGRERAAAIIGQAIAAATTPGHFAALGKALADPVWDAERRQLERARAKTASATTQVVKDFGWANVPAGYRVIAGNESVLDLAVSAKHVVAGHPWGVALYDLEGRPVTRIATGSPAVFVRVAGDTIWTASGTDLVRIDANHAVERLPLDRVEALEVYGGRIWTIGRGIVRQFDPVTRELRTYDGEELRNSTDNTDWYRFVVDGEDLWLVGEDGSRRYDTAADAWKTLRSAEERDAVVDVHRRQDGVLWGVQRSGGRHEVVTIDGATLEARPVARAKAPFPDWCFDRPAVPLTRLTSSGRLVFEASPGPCFAYDPEQRRFAPVAHAEPRTLVRPNPPFEPGHERLWTSVALPDASRLFGRYQDVNHQWRYANAEWREQFSRSMREERRDGLHKVTAKGEVSRLSANFSDTVRGDAVYDVIAVPDGTKWLLTNCGISRLDADDRVVATLGPEDGLPGSRVRSGVLANGKLFLAGGTKGLVVAAPATLVFRTITTAAGLASNAPETLRAGTNGQYELTFAPSWSNQADSQMIPGPQSFDPVTETFGPATPSVRSPVSDVPATEPPVSMDMPILGGYILGRRTIGGKLYLLGTRGVVIASQESQPPAPPRPLEARDTSAAMKALIEQGAAMSDVVPVSVKHLGKLVQHPNPHAVTQVVSNIFGHDLKWASGYTPLVAPLVTHRVMRVRAAAVLVLADSKDSSAAPALRQATGDENPQIRALAAIALAELGQPPDREIFEAIFRDDSGNYPAGANGTYGVIGGKERAQRALATSPSIETIPMLLRNAVPHVTPELAPLLGRAVATNPALAQPLLEARDTSPYATAAVDLARMSLAAAGKPALPVLREALRSQDRVVRSNAARAAGTLGDASLIGPLIAALDLESGLSRASIVWALGELRAEEALPRLLALYAEAKKDAGLGFRHAQVAAATGREYQQITATGTPVDGEKELRDRERLLDAALIVAAIVRIGGPGQQEFFRTNASDAYVSPHAAVHLAAALSGDREKNRTALSALLANPLEQIRFPAAVSLILLGYPEAAEPIILTALSGPSWHRRVVLEQLGRLETPQQLTFARTAVEAVAGDPKEREDVRGLAQQVLAKYPIP